VNRSASKTYSVGVLALVCLVLIAVGIIVVGNEQQLWVGHNEYRIHFTRTNGLAEGAPVKLNGVDVGSVRSMRFPSDPTARYIEVKLSVIGDVAPRIRLDTVGRIQTLGLLGDKYVELTSGPSEAPMVEPNGLIRSVDPVDYETILGQSGDIVSNAIEVTALLKQVLTDINNRSGVIGRLISDEHFGEEVLTEFAKTAENLEAATGRINTLVGRIEQGRGALGVLMSEETSTREALRNLHAATADAAEFSRKLNRGDGMIPRLVNDSEYAERTLSNIERGTTSLADVAAKVRSGRGTIGKLVYDEELYDDARAFVGGSSTGGFWRLLWRGISFFLPPLPAATPEPETAAAAEPDSPTDALQPGPVPVNALPATNRPVQTGTP